MVVAHRGASLDRAEHTLAAYELALRQGADGLECDVRLTRDGQLVCVHDRRVDRTSDGHGVVSARTLASLSTFDYGGWHDEPLRSADELVRVRRAKPSAARDRRGLLTLDGLLGLVRDTAPDTTLFVETKHPVRYAGLVEVRLVAALARHGLARPARRRESRIVVMSFSSAAMRRIREHAPMLPTVLLMGRVPRERRDGSLPPWADIAGPGIDLLRDDPGYVKRARGYGHGVYSWTVDDPGEVDYCRDLGVRYLATNVPADARARLGNATGE